MERRKRITDEDLRLTEVKIAESYSRLKRSVARAPSHAFNSVSETIKRQPLTTVAALAGAGLIGFGLLKLVTSCCRGKEARAQPNLAHQVLSAAIPLLAPHVIGFVKERLVPILSGTSR